MAETRATETSATLVALMHTPSLETLSYSLRHPETWPEDFVWNYLYCRNCAMGLAVELWNLKLPSKTRDYRPWLSRTAREFAMDYEAAFKIFMTLRPPFSWRHPLRSRPPAAVTPSHVADAIDAYVASQRKG